MNKLTNITNKKVVLGVLVFAGLVLGFLGSPHSAAANCFIGSTLQQGSRGPEVACLQSSLGISADGSFGPITRTAVMAFQASHGLSADGVFGPMSRAALTGSPVSGNFPAGCQSASGYSTSTGMPCSGGSNLPAGCLPGYLYSSTTGKKCDGSSQGNGNGNVLTGGAGDAIISKTSTDVEDTAHEGAKNVKVHGFKIEADGSDIAATSLKVTFLANGSGGSSYRLNHYASKVSVWEGSTKVGSADVADFTKSGNEYSKSIQLSNAVVKEGASKKQSFYITVDALPNIDSTDFHATWTLTVSSIRFSDASGVIVTGDYNENSHFQFTSLAASGDVKVVVSKDSSNPIAQNTVVSDTASSKNILLLAFKVKATGSDVTFDRLDIDLTSGGDTLAHILGEVSLKNRSNVLSTWSTFDSDGSQTVSFDLDDTFTVSSDSTEVFKIYATVNRSDKFAASSSVTASFAGFFPEDSNGDVVPDTGSASGETQTFVTNVPVFALVGTPTLVLQTHTDGTSAGKEDLYKATIVMDVTAPDNTSVFLPRDDFNYGTSGTSGVEFSHSGGTIVSAAMQYSGSANILETNNYRINPGDTERFTLNVYLTGDDTQGKVAITSVWYETSPGVPDGNPEVTTGFANFKTPLVLLAK